MSIDATDNNETTYSGDDKFKNYLTIFFLNKHLNGKKISSHMWFFEGFAKFLKPKYCALIDVGTVPAEDGLVNYFKAMEAND